MSSPLHCCHVGQSPLAAARVVVVEMEAEVTVDAARRGAMKKAVTGINKDMNL